MNWAWFERAAGWAAAGLLAIAPARAESVSLPPVADTTLFESAPNDNMGGWTHFVAGTTGSQGDRTRNRALLRFDLAGALRPGARITNAHLMLEVVRVPGTSGGGSAAASTFALHRLLVPWGEGDKLGDRGFPSDPGEATWNHQFAPDRAWTVPGGQTGIDFSGIASAATAVSGKAHYQFGPSSALAADLQLWLDRPTENHGWLLLSQSEGTAKTARAFGSREDPEHAPRLTIEFEPPAALLISVALIAPGTVRLGFTARPDHRYALEAAPEVPPSQWQTVTHWPAGTGGPISVDQEVSGPAHFYRVRED